ncbi:hypothetical protein [Kitasatospora sp. MMS16-BH015]|uniref:hypothetical protein n=1 Tax=Kitasatospora sp. MMS16-BH015 TaxID=2018025 RepID=UPI00131A5C3B|nr:hypothetical protein [Kitasatospora sp. MMS16-BH015]
MRMYHVRPGGRRFRPAVRRLGVGMSLAVALVGAGVLAPVLRWVGELNPGWFALGAYTVLCALLGVVSRPLAAPLVALGAWLFFDGFAVHRYAELGWAGRPDELRLLVFAGAALLASLPAALPRRRIRVEVIRLAGQGR